MRLSHDDAEYDFGFMAVKAMKATGLIRATRTGTEGPKEVPLNSLGFELRQTSSGIFSARP